MRSSDADSRTFCGFPQASWISLWRHPLKFNLESGSVWLASKLEDVPMFEGLLRPYAADHYPCFRYVAPTRAFHHAHRFRHVTRLTYHIEARFRCQNRLHPATHARVFVDQSDCDRHVPLSAPDDAEAGRL